MIIASFVKQLNQKPEDLVVKELNLQAPRDIGQEDITLPECCPTELDLEVHLFVEIRPTSKYLAGSYVPAICIRLQFRVQSSQPLSTGSNGT